MWSILNVNGVRDSVTRGGRAAAEPDDSEYEAIVMCNKLHWILDR